LKLHSNVTRKKGNLHAGQYTILIISRQILLIMKNVLEKRSGENQNTHFVLNNVSLRIVPSMRLCGNTL